MKKEFRIFLGFFLTGLVIILVSWGLYHFFAGIRVTTEEMLNPKAPIWVLSGFFRLTWYLGFIVWACYPIGLVYRLIKRGTK